MFDGTHSPNQPLVVANRLQFQRRGQLFIRAQRNAFRRRDASQQSRSFARQNQSLRRSPNSNRLC